MASKVSFFRCLECTSSPAEFGEFTAKFCDPADIDEQNSSGQTLLHRVITDCAKSRKADFITFLLNKGVDPTVRDHHGATPLYEIVNQMYLSEKKVEKLAQLVDVVYTAAVFNYPAQLSTCYGLDRDHTALSLACCRVFTSVVSRLLARGASVETIVMLGLNHQCYNESGGYRMIKASLLHCLAEHTSSREADKVIHIAKLLVDYGLPIDVASDSEKITPFMLACGRGNEVLVKWFLSSGAQINAVTTQGETPLDFAFTHVSFRPDLSVIRTLIANGAKLGEKSTEFDFARKVYGCGDALFFHEELLKVLHFCSHEAGSSLISFWLLLACAGGYLESVKEIFASKRPIDLDVCEARGMTPFLFACAIGDKDMVELLLHEGSDVKRRANDGQCALHFAAQTRDPELIKKLIPLMPEYINLCSHHQKTPLVAAVEASPFCAASVVALIEAGADHCIIYSGETLLQIAEKINRSSEVAQYLRTLPQS